MKNLVFMLVVGLLRNAACKEQDPCVPNPCENTGACRINAGGYTCECPQKFHGDLCQEHKKEELEKAETRDVCEIYPCKNGGTCLNVNGGFTCRCNTGFSGPYCEESVCVPAPCENSGICVPYYGIALCKCTHQYTGATCSALRKHTITDMTATTKLHETVTKSKVTNINPQTLLFQRVEEILNSDNNPSAAATSTPVNAVTSPTNAVQASSSSAVLRHLTPPTQGVNKPPTQGVQQGTANAAPTTPSDATTTQSILSAMNQGIPPPAQPTIHGVLPSLTTTRGIDKPGNSAVYTTYPQQITTTQQQTTSTAPTTARYVPLTKKEVTTPSAIQPQVNFAAAPLPPTNACVPNPCENQGTCVVRSNGETECICTSQFSGPTCKEIGPTGYSSAPKFFPNDECKHCDRNAICVNGHCICANGYVGDGLECWPSTPADQDWTCTPSPCQNGGTCKPGRSKCVCRLGYVGDYCEKYCPPSVHLSFDKMKGSFVQDESGNENNAVLMNGAEIVYEGGKCDSGASLLGGDILFNGEGFTNKPRDSITIALWIRLDTNRGIQSVFDTVGGRHSIHREGQYHLEIDNGKLRWFHRNEQHITIFSIVSAPLLQEGGWAHVGGTYSAQQREAKLYLNGDVVGIDNNTSPVGFLSQDWETKAGIGKHEHEFGNRLLRGMVDEFYIFACELPRLEILVLMHHCKIYWKDSHAKKKPASAPPRPNNVIVPAGVQNIGFTSMEGAPRVKLLSNHASHQNKPVAMDVSVPVKTRFNIPSAAREVGPATLVDQHHRPLELVMPNGPSALFGEMRELLRQEGLVDQGKRTQISQQHQRVNPNVVKDIEKKLNIKLKPNLQSRYHHAPVIRNENRDLPYSPHAYLNLPNNIAGVSKSTFPSLPGVIEGPTAFLFDHPPAFNVPYLQDAEAQRRWFQWQKGLAMMNGGTYTNTHSNTLQRNDPGTVNANTHVASNQANQGGTSIVSGGPDSPPPQLPADQNEIQPQQQQPPPIQPQAPPPHEQPQLQPQPQPPAAQLAAQRSLIDHSIREQFARMPQLIMKFAQENTQVNDGYPFPHQHAPPQPEPLVHVNQHSHQWGYGNGQGNGNGIGAPQASGSGGGWGAGGPLSQNMNLPGWAGTGHPPEQPQQQDPPPAQVNGPKRGWFPAHAREIWNEFVAASKRQSQSQTQMDTTNVAESGIQMNTQSVQDNNNVQVHGHQYGFGNGNGNAHGYGAPGGSGSGGGWGAGGPTHQNTWVPGQQPPQQHPQQRNVIHSSSFENALANSLVAPWAKQASMPSSQLAQVSHHTQNYAFNPLLNYRRSQIPHPQNNKRQKIKRPTNFISHEIRGPPANYAQKNIIGQPTYAYTQANFAQQSANRQQISPNQQRPPVAQQRLPAYAQPAYANYVSYTPPPMPSLHDLELAREYLGAPVSLAHLKPHSAQIVRKSQIPYAQRLPMLEIPLNLLAQQQQQVRTNSAKPLHGFTYKRTFQKTPKTSGSSPVGSATSASLVSTNYEPTLSVSEKLMLMKKKKRKRKKKRAVAKRSSVR